MEVVLLLGLGLLVVAIGLGWLSLEVLRRQGALLRRFDGLQSGLDEARLAASTASAAVQPTVVAADPPAEQPAQAAAARAQGLLRQGRLAEAAEWLGRAAALEPGQAETHNDLGSALGQLGRLDEAAASFRRALALDARLPSAHYNLGTALLNLGRPAEA